MAELGTEDGLRVVDARDTDPELAEAAEAEDGPELRDLGNGDTDLEALRDAFVEAFNARDLDGILALVEDDVECPDIRDGDGVSALAEEVEAIWERSPGAILTRAHLDLDDEPVAIGWLPDEDGCWSRAALVCFDTTDGLLSLVAMPEDADALDRAAAEEPTGDELDEWSDWAGWERGEETLPHERP
jgi:hypothetical protein